MKRGLILTVLLTGLPLASGFCIAQPPAPDAAADIGRQNSNPSLIPSRNSLKKFSPIRTGDTMLPEGAFNGYAQIRSTADLGAPGSAGNGFNHFSNPFDRYTTWYRPRAASLTKYQRCEPESFRPRGFGNLFARPCDGYRMEYEPYGLDDAPSKYGPSYFARMPDPRCDDCCHGEDDCR